MKKDLIFPAGHPPPRGSYSPGIRIRLGDSTLRFMTGQLAVDPAGNVVAPGDAAGQAEYVFGLVGSILSAAGMDFGDVVKVDTFLADRADFDKFSAVRNRHFPVSPPVSTLIEVKGLARAGCLIEVEVVAVK